MRRARIEIIPMIDTIFFLLVFFMITTVSGIISCIGMPAPKQDNAAATTRRTTADLDQDSECVTVRIDNHLYEVDLSLRTLEIQLRFDPFKLDRIEVSYRGTSFGLAKPVNLHLNSQIRPGSDYEKRA